MRAIAISGIVVAFALSGCSSAPAAYVSSETGSGDVVDLPADVPTGATPVGNACDLMDADTLNSILGTVESPFGGPLVFQNPIQTPPNAYCSWKDPAIPAEIQILLEDAATSELEDHSERAFNIDVDPVVEAQDGPGERAVILIDTAFGSDAEGLPYGYFFVHDDLAVYVKVTFIDIGRDLLRVIAQEVDARI